MMMKRSRKKLKAFAKSALLGNYGTVAGSMLLSALVMFVIAIPMLAIMVMAMFAGMAGSGTMEGGMTGLLLGMGVWYILILIVSTLLMAGVTRICYQFCIGQTGKLADLLYAFKNHPVRFVGLSLLVMLITLLGAVPGIALMIFGELVVKDIAGTVLYLIGYVLVFILSIAAALRYVLAVFVLIEEPWRKVGECIRLSKDMMAGNKMRLFMLEVSFFGILLLNYLTLGLGSIWIMPYIISTNIFFYLSVKEEKYRKIPPEYESQGLYGTENGDNIV